MSQLRNLQASSYLLPVPKTCLGTLSAKSGKVFSLPTEILIQIYAWRKYCRAWNIFIVKPFVLESATHWSPTTHAALCGLTFLKNISAFLHFLCTFLHSKKRRKSGISLQQWNKKEICIQSNSAEIWGGGRKADLMFHQENLLIALLALEVHPHLLCIDKTIVIMVIFHYRLS